MSGVTVQRATWGGGKRSGQQLLPLVGHDVGHCQEESH